MRIVTVSREFGSGGRELGKRLADALCMAYIDREIASELAKRCALDEKYLENAENRSVIRAFPISYSRSFARLPAVPGDSSALLGRQQDVIRELARRGDCVVVGRSAEAILEAFHPLRLFVYADMPSKLSRCRSRAGADEHMTDRELEKQIRRIDKSRSENHMLVSALKWGDPLGYDLCVNSSNVEIKTIVPGIAAFADAWFGRK